MSNVDILVVVDTNYLKEKHPNPSKNPKSPTPLSHEDLYMICAATNLSANQATADLAVKARPRDVVSFRGTSISANSDDAVIVYGIEHWTPTDKPSDYIFNRFEANTVTLEKAVSLDPNGPPLDPGDVGLNVTHGPKTFLSLDSTVSKAGTEFFYVYIAVFELDSSTEEQQTLYGCYYWDPSIVVE